jgi:thioredoxin reductase
VRDEQLGIIANGDIGFDFAGLIHNWSKQLTLFTNGPSTLTSDQRDRLKLRKINLVETPISEIVHQSGVLNHLVLQGNSKAFVKAIFAKSGWEQHSSIPQKLGCNIVAEGHTKGLIQVNEMGMTSVPGVYAAGDNCSPMRSLSAAIASGTMVGAALNRDLIKESF